MELSGSPKGAGMRLKLVTKLEGSGFPVVPAGTDEDREITGKVVNVWTLAMERQHVKEDVF